MTHRKELEVLINSNGGEYRGNLTKDVTHLIAKVPSGNKYVYAGFWGVKIVALEWLEQSLERGMILDEDLYSLALSENERGRNAWIRRTGSTTSLGKRARDSEVAPNNPRQLRRTASAKLSNQSVGLWTDIVGAEPTVVESKSSEWDEKQRDPASESATIKTEGTSQPSKRVHQLSSIDMTNVAQVEAESWPPNEHGAQKDPKPLHQGSLPKRGLFHGKTFALHGFGEKKVNVLTALMSRDIVNLGYTEFNITEAPLFSRCRNSIRCRPSLWDV